MAINPCWTFSGGLFSLTNQVTWGAALPKTGLYTAAVCSVDAHCFYYSTSKLAEQSNYSNDMVSPTSVVNGVQEGTTQIVTSQTDEIYQRNSAQLMSKEYSDLEVDDTVGIKDFLAKPVPVATGTFDVSDVELQLKFSSQTYYLIQSQPIWWNKIQGYLNIRGTVKYRLVINPTPFQAGLVRLSFFPCQNILQQESSMHLYDKTTISQLPGVYLNFNDNYAEFSAPYVSPTTFLQRDSVESSDYVDWGSIYIHVFTPLSTGTGPSSVSYTLWMSIEDLELSGMVVPQGVDSQFPVQEVEASRGPIGNIMANTTRLLTSVGSIPSLLPLATKASWVTRAIGGFADAFGWSKPTSSLSQTVTAVGVHSNAVNTKGMDGSVPMSLDPTNLISPSHYASPSGLDEMSFNFIKSRWAVYGAYTWSTAAATGDTLINIDVSPYTMNKVHFIGTTSFFSTVPAAVFTNFYSNYRGSFEFRLRLIKTGFHTGTLSVAYLPGRKATTLTYANAPYVYRQILDIQEGTEFCYTLPYLISQDFLPCTDKIGLFCVQVVNPLRAPETVAGSISVYLEIRGGPDLTYAVPLPCSVSPFVPQGVDVEQTGLAECVVLGANDPAYSSINYCQLAIGEIQQSLLELLKANNSVAFRPGVDRPGVNQVCAFSTGRAGSVRWNGTVFTSSEYGGDLFSLFTSMFAMSRGSMRYRLLPLGSTDKTAFRSILLTPGMLVAGNSNPVYYTTNYPPAVDSRWIKTLTSDTAAVTDLIGASARVYQTPAINSGLAVQIPFYSKYRFVLNRLYANTGFFGQTFVYDTGIAFKTNSGDICQLQRSVGDDFQMSYFVGVPLLILNKDFYVNS